MNKKDETEFESVGNCRKRGLRVRNVSWNIRKRGFSMKNRREEQELSLESILWSMSNIV